MEIVSEKEGLKTTITSYINRKVKGKRRLKAEQFLDNPNNYDYADHINGNTSDYALSNLRWVSQSQNLRNIGDYNKQFENEVMKALDYGNHELEDGKYYFWNNIFYKYNGVKYEKLHVTEDKLGYKYVTICEKNGYFKVSYIKFKKQYSIL
jgi:hypothetical protein